MDNENINRDKMAWAQKVVDDLNNSTDKYVVYRTSRPITDIKHMLTTSVELYGDNVAFMQRFEKNEPRVDAHTPSRAYALSEEAAARIRKKVEDALAARAQRASAPAQPAKKNTKTAVHRRRRSAK